jgi:hypothetical protein
MKGVVFTTIVLAAACLVALVSFGMRGVGTGGPVSRFESATGRDQPVVGESEGAGQGTYVGAEPDSAAFDPRHAGLDVFLAYRCEMCHTVRAVGIGVADEGGASAEVESPEGSGSPASKADSDDPMDLSDVGQERTTEWLHLYLRREASIEGAKHYRAFGGSDAEQAVLVEWLVGLNEEDAGAEEAVDVKDADDAEERDDVERGDDAEVTGDAAEADEVPKGENAPRSDTGE